MWDRLTGRIKVVNVVGDFWERLVVAIGFGKEIRFVCFAYLGFGRQS